MRDFVAAGWLVCALLAFYLAYWADAATRMRFRASGWRSMRLTLTLTLVVVAARG
jgi:hypothetical protein